MDNGVRKANSCQKDLTAAVLTANSPHTDTDTPAARCKDFRQTTVSVVLNRRSSPESPSIP